MRKLLALIILSFLYSNAFSQMQEKSIKQTLLKSSAENACKCVDSIITFNKSQEEVSKEINRCINDQTGVYQVGSKVLDTDDLKQKAVDKDGKKEINVSINMDKNSVEFKKFYFEMERYMMDNCQALKDKAAKNEKQREKSLSQNSLALELFTKGIDETKKDNSKEALIYFEKAVEIDSQFAFAWDNIGLAYRKLGDYDKALSAYQKSLDIDPKGVMPLQNIAIVYQYKKEYNKALVTYEKLAEIDKNNPEVYYGIGRIYAIQLNDYEKGLENMCKAYNLYIEQKSPYRTDAEKIIQIIFSAMKKEGKESKFTEILKQNNITTGNN